ncbi:MAG: hypothetical protein ABII79_06390 [bacterium]
MYLNSEWEKHYKQLGLDASKICRDGKLNAEKYKAAGKKILFVLKETNDYKGGLQNLLKNGPRFQMWHAVARWAHGILHDFPSFDENMLREELTESLHRVAAINLKKATGGASSDMSVINAYAFRDRELLLKQIGEIKPELIVACGTFDILVWLLELNVKPDRPMQEPVKDKTGDVWVIPFRHPARTDNRKTYCELKKPYKLTSG